MLWSYLPALALLGGCGRAERAPAPTAPPRIEARDAAGHEIARVTLGRPCRASIEGFDLIVGIEPFIAQHGATAWTAERAADGTTFLRDGAPAARLYANQLFDADGAPIVRVVPGGGVANRAGAIARRAERVPATNAVRVGDVTVTGTTDVALAALLAAPEATPDVRALVACYLLHSEAAAPRPEGP